MSLVSSATLVSLLAIVVTATLSVYTLIDQHRRASHAVTVALSTEMARLQRDIEGHVDWLKSPDAKSLPLVKFATPVYDAQAINIGLLRHDFAAVVVAFYGMIGFVNSLQNVRTGYEAAGADAMVRFWRSYEAALRNVTAFADIQDGVPLPSPQRHRRKRQRVRAA